MTEDKLSAGQMQIFARAVPDLRAGKHTVSVTQQVWDDTTKSHRLLHMSDSFRVNVVGPKYRLSPRDVLGAFPAAGAQEASNLRVPHVALQRRTLPWERLATNDRDLPWMALLLLEISGDGKADGDGNLNLEYGAKLKRNHSFPEGRGDCLEISGFNLRKLAPSMNEMKLLTHVRRVSLDDTEGEFAGDDDGYVAIVMGNRLPAADKNWLAVLVSLEGHTNIGAWGGTQRLPVLYYWTYRTAALGGDFQAWAQALNYNGGVQLLGQVPNERERTREPKMDGLGGVEFDHRERDGKPERGLYHGPALAVPTERSPDIILSSDRARQVAAGKYDVSYAAAFELGRLLAMADRGILQALIAYRRAQYELRQEELFRPKIQPTFELPIQMTEDWIGRLTGDWFMNQILTKGDLVTNPLDNFFNQFGRDPTGMLEHLGQLPGLDQSHLANIGLAGLHEAAGIPGLGQTPGAELPGHGGLDLGLGLEAELDVGIGLDAELFELDAGRIELGHALLVEQNMFDIIDD